MQPGLKLIVAGMVVIGYIDNFVRVIAEGVSVWQFHLLRTALALPLLALAAGFGLRLRPLRPLRVAVRSAVQAAGDTGSRAASAVEDPATEESGA